MVPMFVWWDIKSGVHRCQLVTYSILDCYNCPQVVMVSQCTLIDMITCLRDNLTLLTTTVGNDVVDIVVTMIVWLDVDKL